MTPEFWLNLQNLYDLDLARALNRYRNHRIIECGPIAAHASSGAKGRGIEKALIGVL